MMDRWRQGFSDRTSCHAIDKLDEEEMLAEARMAVSLDLALSAAASTDEGLSELQRVFKAIDKDGDAITRPDAIPAKAEGLSATKGAIVVELREEILLVLRGFLHAAHRRHFERAPQRRPGRRRARRRNRCPPV